MADQPTNDFDRLSKIGFRMAELALTHRTMTPPTLIVKAPGGTLMVNVGSFFENGEEGKDAIGAIAPQILKDLDATAYVLTVEAWVVQKETLDDVPTVLPRDDPNRVEVVMCVGGDQTGSYGVTRAIDRSVNPPRLGELCSMGTLIGRMANWLSRSKDN